MDGVDRPGNVDKIRDILFGTQMRDYDKKFARLEERLLKETADLREDMKRRIVSIEAFMKGEIQALSDAQKAERSDREDAVKELAGELKESTKALEKRNSQSDEQNSKAQRDTRQLVLEESRRLSEEIGQKHADLTASLARESQELRAMLTDRLALADIFAEMSLRLKNELTFPGA